MADRNQISLRIKTIVEGLKEIDKLVSEIDELGGQAGETGQEAKALNAEFQRLQKQQNTISQFQKLNSSIDKTAKDLDTARAKATALGACHGHGGASDKGARQSIRDSTPACQATERHAGGTDRDALEVLQQDEGGRG